MYKNVNFSKKYRHYVTTVVANISLRIGMVEVRLTIQVLVIAIKPMKIGISLSPIS